MLLVVNEMFECRVEKSHLECEKFYMGILKNRTAQAPWRVLNFYACPQICVAGALGLCGKIRHSPHKRTASHLILELRDSAAMPISAANEKCTSNSYTSIHVYIFHLITALPYSSYPAFAICSLSGAIR